MIDLTLIKNIIFDLGGVLLNLDFNLTRKAFNNLGTIDFDDFYSKAKQNRLFDDFEIGAINEATFCDQLKKSANLNASNEQIIDAWNAMLLDFPLERKRLLNLFNNRFNTSLLSNTNETHIRAFNQIIQKDINETSLNPLFDNVYFSNEIGLRKPNTDAFKFVLEQNNYVPSETLFLDDSPQHLEGAKQIGIHTFHIQDVPIEKIFSDLLLKSNSNS